MNNVLQVLYASLETGLVFSILAMGVVLTYKILDIADLSVEGTFPLGAFIFAMIVTKGLNPIVAIGISFIAGLLAGLITYLFFKKVGIQPLLSGILTMTILYSVNLRVVGKSNITLFDQENIFKMFSFLPNIVILGIIVILIKLIIDWFFKTEKGYLLVSTGDNETLVKALGKNPSIYIMAGLMLSNGLVSMSGALMAQYQGFADVNMGASMIVTALASIIIGDSFLRNNTKLKRTSRAIIGACAYRIIIGIAMYLGMSPGDLKAITAIIVIIFIGYNNATDKFLMGMRRKSNV